MSAPGPHLAAAKLPPEGSSATGGPQTRRRLHAFFCGRSPSRTRTERRRLFVDANQHFVRTALTSDVLDFRRTFRKPEIRPFGSLGEPDDPAVRLADTPEGATKLDAIMVLTMMREQLAMRAAGAAVETEDPYRHEHGTSLARSGQARGGMLKKSSHLRLPPMAGRPLEGPHRGRSHGADLLTAQTTNRPYGAGWPRARVVKTWPDVQWSRRARLKAGRRSVRGARQQRPVQPGVAQ